MTRKNIDIILKEMMTLAQDKSSRSNIRANALRSKMFLDTVRAADMASRHSKLNRTKVTNEIFDRPCPEEQ
jgi:hypothetical protein